MLFPGVDGEALLIALDLKGLACSTGAACSSGAVAPSHVLTAIGLNSDEARSSLRFSLGRHTTREESQSVNFVEYLRLVFAWGGFPGWKNGDAILPAEIKELRDGLLPI